MVMTNNRAFKKNVIKYFKNVFFITLHFSKFSKNIDI